MIKYYIYGRKSTEEEERQILSIEAQLTELREFAKQNNLFIDREFTESKSAKEPGREVFNEMLLEIEKGSASGILAWNPDRLARNSVDGGKVIYLVDTSKIESLKFPTFWFEATPQGKFMLSVAFGQAKYYTDNLRENILRGIRQKLRRGEMPSKAPRGYFNEPRIRTIEPDIKTFSKVKKILELFATGNYTLSTIQSKMFSFGLAGKTGKPLALSTILNFLNNPFYYGLFYRSGELHQGTHKPMISKKLFDKIQQALHDNGKPRKNLIKIIPLFYNLARCGDCGYMITAEKKRKPSGREYIYYRCTKKSKVKKCQQHKFLREEDLKTQIKQTCQKVSLPDEWQKKFLEKIKEWETQEDHSSNLFAQNLKEKLEKVKIKIDRLLDAHLEGAIGLEDFKNKKNELVEQRAEIQQKLADFERKENHWLELTKNWVIEASQTDNLVLREDFSEMKKLLKKIGSNRQILNQKLIIVFQKPWDSLCKTTAEARRAEANNTDKNLTNSLWWR